MKKNTQLLAERLRSFLDPEKVVDVKAREGTEILAQGLSDHDVLLLAFKLLVKKVPIEEILDEFLSLSDDRETLHRAIQRFSLKCIPYVLDIRKAGGTKFDEKEVQPVVRRTVVVQEDCDAIFARCKERAKKSSPLDDMQFLLEVQKERLLRQSRQVFNGPNPFLMSNALNGTADSIRKLGQSIMELQMQMGIVKKVPMQIQGAFQTYVDGLSREAQQEWVLVGNKLLETLDEKLSEKNSSDRGIVDEC